jgi:hypothetical protein
MTPIALLEFSIIYCLTCFLVLFIASKILP